MINESVFEKNEECIRCGGKFNLHFGFCVDCKSNNNSESVDKLEHKFQAVRYREGNYNNNHVLIAVLQSRFLGNMNFIVPIDSQLSYKVRYNVNNAIYDYLEEDEKIINFFEYTDIKINSEKYYVDFNLL